MTSFDVSKKGNVQAGSSTRNGFQIRKTFLEWAHEKNVTIPDISPSPPASQGDEDDLELPELNDGPSRAPVRSSYDASWLDVDFTYANSDAGDIDRRSRPVASHGERYYFSRSLERRNSFDLVVDVACGPVVLGDGTEEESNKLQVPLAAHTRQASNHSPYAVPFGVSPSSVVPAYYSAVSRQIKAGLDITNQGLGHGSGKRPTKPGGRMLEEMSMDSVELDTLNGTIVGREAKRRTPRELEGQNKRSLTNQFFTRLFAN